MKNNGGIIQNWAEAIFQIYVEKKELKKLESECLDLLTIFSRNRKIFAILSSLNLQNSEKKKIIKEAFKKCLSYDLYNALNLMIDKRVSFLAFDILKEIIALIDKENNIKHGIVYSAIDLDRNQIKKIEEKISYKLKTKVKLINRIDTTIIAGLKIVVDHLVFDYTFISKLKDIKNKMIITK